jgi:hypothetical protein
MGGWSTKGTCRVKPKVESFTTEQWPTRGGAKADLILVNPTARTSYL